MMLKKLLMVALLAGGCVAAHVSAEPVAATTTVAAPTVPALFLQPVFLRGTLGDAQVQLSIRPKAEIDEGIEGEYFVFGNSLNILLAGEIEGDILFMEESENGTNISGQWDGKLDGDTLEGNWMSADGSIIKPFVLKVVTLKQASAPKAGNRSSKP